MASNEMALNMPKRKGTIQSIKTALPFYPDEVTGIQNWIQNSTAIRVENNEQLVSACWQKILEAARLADVQKKFELIPINRSRAGQTLGRFLAKAKPPMPKNNTATLALLALGATRLNLIPHPETGDQTTYKKLLSTLTRPELRDSAKRAMKEPLSSHSHNRTPLLSSDKGGRPSADALNTYVSTLLDIYTRASDQKLPMNIIHKSANTKWKPIIEFVQLCIPERVFGNIAKPLIGKVVLRNR